MKFKFIVITTLLLSFSMNAQDLRKEKTMGAEFETVEFSKAENPPLAPGCETKLVLEEKQACTRSFIQQHVMKNFTSKRLAKLKTKGRIEATLEFVIDKNGNPTKITATGGPEAFKQTAIKIIGLLPKFQPGTVDGKPVNVSFKFPLRLYIPN